MATKYEKLFQALSEPFSAEQIKYKPLFGKGQRAGDAAYVDARCYENRLDLVLGPENWWTDYEVHNNGVICKFSMKMDDGSIITKSGAGQYTQVAEFKGGVTDAFKRAVSHATGMGRHLYDVGVVDYEAGTDAPGASHQEPPRQPQQQPNNGHQAQPQAQARPAGSQAAASGPHAQYGRLPGKGGALFYWAKEMDAKFGCDLLKYVGTQGKILGFPQKWTEWDEGQTAEMVAICVQKLDEFTGNSSPAEQPATAVISTPVVAAAGDFALKAQRDRVRKIVAKIIETRKQPLDNAACLETMDEIGRMVGQSIPDIQRESNAELLTRFIEKAEELLHQESTIPF
jgi:hypothetical protein